MHGPPVTVPTPEASYPLEGPAEPEAPEEKSRWHKTGHWAGLITGCAVIGAIIGLVIVGFLKFVNGPVTASAKPDPLADARKKIEPTPDMRILSGREVELRYQSMFDAVGTQQQATGEHDQYYISSKANPARSLALTVSAQKSAKLEDDSGYKWRLSEKAQYKASPTNLGLGKAMLFSKVDNTEATLFWSNGSKELALSLTSTDPHDNPAAMMQQIMPTIRWK
jgi:hypothetical protein